MRVTRKVAILSGLLHVPVCTPSEPAIEEILRFVDSAAMTTISSHAVQKRWRIEGLDPESLGPEFQYLVPWLGEAAPDGVPSEQFSTWSAGRFAGYYRDRSLPSPLARAYAWDGSTLLSVDVQARTAQLEGRFSTMARFWPHNLFGIYGVIPVSRWIRAARKADKLDVRVSEEAYRCSFPCESLGVGLRIVFQRRPSLRLQSFEVRSLDLSVLVWKIDVLEWAGCSKGMWLPRRVRDRFRIPSLPGRTRIYKKGWFVRELEVTWDAGVHLDVGEVMELAGDVESFSDGAATYLTARGYDRLLDQQAKLLGRVAKRTVDTVETNVSEESSRRLGERLWKEEGRPSWRRIDARFLQRLRTTGWRMDQLEEGWCGHAALAMLGRLLGKRVAFEDLVGFDRRAQMSLESVKSMGEQFGVPLKGAHADGEASSDVFLTVIGRSAPYHIGVVVVFEEQGRRKHLLWTPPHGFMEISRSRLRELNGPDTVLVPR